MTLVAAVLVAPAPAHAADYLAASDVGPGECTPGEVLTGQKVDCRFPLLENSDLDPWGPHVVDVGVGSTEEDLPSCVVEGDHLVCRSIDVGWRVGSRKVSLIVGGTRTGTLAEFVVRDASAYPVTFTPEWFGEPYVFPDNPLRLWVDGPQRHLPAWAVVSRRGDAEPMGILPLPPVGSEDYSPVALEVEALPPGRYLVTPCLGFDSDTCEVVPGGVPFQVGDGELIEVVPGWNLAAADRINVVFAPTGDTTPQEALEIVSLLLGWDGPVGVGYDDELVSDPGESVWTVRFGPFATSPLARSRHLFNLWMLDDVLVDARALDHTSPPVGWDRPAPDFGLPDVQVTVVDVLGPGRFGRSEALWPSFSAPFGPVDLRRDGLRFGSVYLAVPAEGEVFASETLTHEWGHAIFDLRDEYSEEGRQVAYGYPNCAPDLATAQEWWSDLVGEVDPFIEEYRLAFKRFRATPPPVLDGQLAIDFVPGGCYSTRTDESVRPSVDSLMNSALPVFGSVNRRHVETVLAMWNGRADFFPEAATVECSTVAWREVSVGCTITLLPMVDPPTGAIEITVGRSRARCSLVDEAVPARFHCGPVQVDAARPGLAMLRVDGMAVASGRLVAVSPWR